jgi:hypothetical protein
MIIISILQVGEKLSKHLSKISALHETVRMSSPAWLIARFEYIGLTFYYTC